MRSPEDRSGLIKFISAVIAILTIIITVWAIKLLFCTLAAVIVLFLVDFVCGTAFFTATYVASLAIIFFIIGLFTN